MRSTSFAFAPEHDQVRHYKVDRIEAVEVSSFIFQRPRDFDVADHLAGSFGIYGGDRRHHGRRQVHCPPAARYVSEVEVAR